jgi:protein involved in polysaccharide export with SLBB domain
MKITPLRRALALFLSTQPVFWTGNLALAQAYVQPGAAPQDAQTGMPLELQQAQRGGAQTGLLPNVPTSVQQALQAGGQQTGAPQGPLPGGPQGLLPGGPLELEPLRDRSAVPALGAAAVPAPIDEPLDPETYRCGHGDVIELAFWGLQNFKLRATVDLEGRLFVPKMGFLALQGKSFAEARALLREQVARYYPRLAFEVTLVEPRTFLVQLVDAVMAPGSYPARAVDRVATLLGRGGGLAPGASRRRVEIRRRTGEVVVADLVRFARTGRVADNPLLLDGDVVHVPYEALAVTVEGAVNRPGRYELVGAKDLAELVEVAGGLAAGATGQLPITLVHRNDADRQDLQLVAWRGPGLVPALELRHEDRVRVPGLAELQRSVMVVGAVAGARRYDRSASPASGTAAEASLAPDEATSTYRLPWADGDTVRTVLDRVGGVGPLADLKGSYLLRGQQTLPVDLYSLVMLKDIKADQAVRLGDVLVVPFGRRNVQVEGAVFAPGIYPYHPAFGIEQYLALAGGRNRFAQPLSDVRLILPNGALLEYQAGLTVEPGSSLVVPERNFSRSEIVQIALGVASVLVSGVAVVLAARR